MTDLPFQQFGGIGSEGYNALMSALVTAAGSPENLYAWLDETPKTTVVVFTVDALRSLGYDIVKVKND